MTLLADSFEGVPLWAADSHDWTITTSQAYDGTHSAHAPSSFGMTPTMIYGPFDLSAATAAELDFELMYTAPTPGGGFQTGGAFGVGYSTDDSQYTFPYQWSGDTSGAWQAEQFDLGSADFPLVGQPQVWIALQTTVTSASSGYAGGAWVDDLSLSATIPDTTAPTTTAAGFDANWHRTPVTVTFTATDNSGGSGVAYTQYSTDGGTDWTQGTSVAVPAPANHSGDGTHTILYRSADQAGNLEVAKSCQVKIDTTGPVCAAHNATVKRGQSCRLYFKVHDALSPKVTNVLTITTRSGVVKKRWTWGYGTNFTGFWWISYRCNLPKGTYRLVVTGKDLAGNRQSVVGKARFYVK